MKDPIVGRAARRLVLYGLFLFFVAIVAVSYEPRTGAFGFNPAAKTALASGGICGGLSVLWGVLFSRGFVWALPAAITSTLLFLAAFTWRSTVGWMAFAAGQSEKWFAATLITLMWTASLALLLHLVTVPRR